MPDLCTLCNDFDAGLFESAKKQACKEFNECAQDLNVPCIADMNYGSDLSVKRLDGDAIWADLMNTITQIFPECWEAQELLVQALLNLMVRKVYGDQLDSVVDRLMRDHGWDASVLCNILLIICPRRFGKTKATAAVVAALLLCIPNFKHVHFSVKVQLSQEFLGEVKAFVMATDRGQAMMTGKSQSKECLTLIGDKNGLDVRTCKIMAANTQVCPYYTCVCDAGLYSNIDRIIIIMTIMEMGAIKHYMWI